MIVIEGYGKGGYPYQGQKSKSDICLPVRFRPLPLEEERNDEKIIKERKQAICLLKKSKLLLKSLRMSTYIPVQLIADINLQRAINSIYNKYRNSEKNVI